MECRGLARHRRAQRGGRGTAKGGKEYQRRCAEKGLAARARWARDGAHCGRRLRRRTDGAGGKVHGGAPLGVLVRELRVALKEGEQLHEYRHAHCEEVAGAVQAVEPDLEVIQTDPNLVGFREPGACDLELEQVPSDQRKGREDADRQPKRAHRPFAQHAGDDRAACIEEALRVHVGESGAERDDDEHRRGRVSHDGPDRRRRDPA